MMTGMNVNSGPCLTHAFNNIHNLKRDIAHTEFHPKQNKFTKILRDSK